MSMPLMIMPGVQKPHCRPWFSWNACCMGCSVVPEDSPSMVVTRAPAARAASMVQDFTATPSTSTRQAPHCEVSQPIWVPVRRRWSRRIFDQKRAVLDLGRDGLAVDGHRGRRTRRRLSVQRKKIRMTTMRTASAISPHICGPPRKPRAAAPSARSSAILMTSSTSCSTRGEAVLAADLVGEGGEELVGHLLGGGVDQAGADLGELAADLGLGGVGEQRHAVVVGQRHVGAALGEAGDAALAFAADGVAIGRIEIGQRDVALEGRRDRADLGLDGRRHLGVGELLQLLAAGDALLEHDRIVERGPDLLARCRDPIAAGHFHGQCHPSQKVRQAFPLVGVRWFRTAAGTGGPRAARAFHLRGP